MKKRAAADSIDGYIAEFPPEVRTMLQQIREIIRAAAPGATETISYAIPTFDLKGRHLVHFAAFKNHIGFYPTSSGIAAFEKDLQTYKTSTGAVRFPFGQPLPKELIVHIVKFRVAEITGTR